mgnify:FL=1
MRKKQKFENFLYTSSSLYTTNNNNSITWPYNNGVRVESTSPTISNTSNTGWYDNLITLAEEFDIENSNWVQNNIPQYILNNSESSSIKNYIS